MNRIRKTVLALAAAVGFGLVALPAMAADNPFAVQAGSGGYQTAEAEAKCGKCGKCGAAMGMGDSSKAEPAKTTEEKTTATGKKKCGASKAATATEPGKAADDAGNKCGGAKK